MRSELTRREFLVVTAATAATIGLSRLSFAQDVAPINTGFIGVGAQGQELLKRCLRIPGVNMKAICDIYPPHYNQALKMCAEKAKGYTDYRQLLDDKSIECVLIATPLYMHAPMVIDALSAGKTVFCEKCMGRTPDAARKMAQAVERTGKWLQIGHQRSASPIYQQAKKMIADEGVLGKVTHARAWWHRNGSWRRNVEPKYEKLLNWRLYKEYSGGLMTELGSHQVHLVNWFTGEVPMSVVGYGGIDYYKDGREVMDNVCCTFLYPDGKKLYYSSIQTNQFDGFGEEFMGDKGTLVTSVEKGLLYKEPQAKDVAWAEEAKKEKVNGQEAIVLDASETKKKKAGEHTAAGTLGADNQDDYMSELVNFFDDVVRKNKRPLCDHVDAFKVAVAVLGANKAMEIGTKVQFKPSDFEIGSK
jgi:predicted dehydrogenase